VTRLKASKPSLGISCDEQELIAFRLIHSILIAAHVTIIAHHIQNPAAAAPSSIEKNIHQQLLADLDTMVHGGDNPILEEKITFCKRLLSTYEAHLRAQTMGEDPPSIAITG
jgi:hypothetical protein